MPVTMHELKDRIAPRIQAHVPTADCDNVEALVIEELRRRHEEVLARHGLRPSNMQDGGRAGAEGAHRVEIVDCHQ